MTETDGVPINYGLNACNWMTHTNKYIERLVDFHNQISAFEC